MKQLLTMRLGKSEEKREANAHKYKRENPNKGDSIYILSGLIKCPLCNAGLYGNKSIKRNKNKKDEYYKTITTMLVNIENM